MIDNSSYDNIIIEQPINILDLSCSFNVSFIEDDIYNNIFNIIIDEKNRMFIDDTKICKEFYNKSISDLYVNSLIYKNTLSKSTLFLYSFININEFYNIEHSEGYNNLISKFKQILLRHINHTFGKNYINKFQQNDVKYINTTGLNIKKLW